MPKGILLIEDDKNVSKILEMRLEAEGYKVLTAYNGGDGWDLAKTQKPDLIILDIDLPVVDGLTLCGLIKKSSKTKNIPVIMLTAKDKMDDLEKGFVCGADTYLSKPYVWERLRDNIESFLKV